MFVQRFPQSAHRLRRRTWAPLPFPHFRKAHPCQASCEDDSCVNDQDGAGTGLFQGGLAIGLGGVTIDTDGVLTKPRHLPVLQEILLLIVQVPLGVKRRMRNKEPARSAIGVDAATGTLGQGGVFQCFLEQAIYRAGEGMDEGIDGRSVSGVLHPHARLQLVGPVEPALGTPCRG